MNPAHSELAHRYEEIRHRIRDAAMRSGRAEGSVSLLAVSKRHSPERVAEVARLGQRDFAENYVQEALDKRQAVAEIYGLADLVWHFIGPIQSNKTRLIAEHFDWVHSVDRDKVATRLSDQRPPGRPPLNVFIQVNIDDEETKSGVPEAALPELIAHCRALPNLHLVGLMCIPERGTRTAFERLATLRDRYAPDLPYLSMGMSEDFESAIEAGSTHVRVGSALFGARE